MNLSELKSLLTEHSDRHFRIACPTAARCRFPSTSPKSAACTKPSSTAAARCANPPPASSRSGSARTTTTVSKPGKWPPSSTKAKPLLPDDSIPVEIEYEDRVISQYTITGHELTDDAVILQLAHKHTECLAPELCGLPSLNRLPAIGGKSGPDRCC